MAKLSEEKYAKLYKKYSLLAESKNGKLLSPQFCGMSKDHLWHCNKHNHTWKAKPNALKDYPSKSGTWCPKCAIESLPQNNFKYSIDDLMELATSKPGGGECLSKEYKGIRAIHTWKCGTCGFIWYARPNDIMGRPTRPTGSWCPRCAKENSAALMKIKTKSYPRDERGKFVSKPP